MDKKTMEDLLEFLKYEKGRRTIQLNFAEECYERALNSKGDNYPGIEQDVERMTKLRNTVIRYKHFIHLLENELEEKRGEQKFSLIVTMPIFQKSDEQLVESIVEQARDIIKTYGCVSIMDVYDIIDNYIPAFSNSIGAKSNYLYTKYGWKKVSDVYVVYANGGLTIGSYCDPISLVD